MLVLETALVPGKLGNQGIQPWRREIEAHYFDYCGNPLDAFIPV